MGCGPPLVSQRKGGLGTPKLTLAGKRFLSAQGNGEGVASLPRSGTPCSAVSGKRLFTAGIFNRTEP